MRSLNRVVLPFALATLPASALGSVPDARPPEEPAAPASAVVLPVIEIVEDPPGPSLAFRPLASVPAAPLVVPGAEPIDDPVRGPEVSRRLWSRRLVIAGTTGVANPLGDLGAVIEYVPHRVVGLAVGGGLGGPFGPALGLHAVFRPWTFGRWAPALGTGFSLNFTPSTYRDLLGLSAPAASAWYNVDAGFEYRMPSGFMVRLLVGMAVLMNTGQFQNYDWPGYYGPSTGTSNLVDPVDAADSRDQGRPLVLFEGSLTIGYAFAL